MTKKKSKDEKRKVNKGFAIFNLILLTAIGLYLPLFLILAILQGVYVFRNWKKMD